MSIYTIMLLLLHTEICKADFGNAFRVSNKEVTGVVNYQTVSAKDLAKAVLTQGQWSQLLVF